MILQPDATWPAEAATTWWGAQTGSWTLESAREPEQPFGVVEHDENHPVWKLFRDGTHGDVLEGSFFRRIAGIALSGGTPLARYRDGLPAIVSKPHGRGTLVLWNAEIAADGSDWAGRQAFVPFIGEFITHLTHTTEGDAPPRDTPPGSLPAWETTQPVVADQVMLRAPGGTEEKLATTHSAGITRFRALSPARPGHWHWLVDGQTVERMAVNLAESESDLRSLPAEAIRAGEVLDTTAGAGLLARRDGLPVWPWLLGLCALLLAAETVLSMIFATGKAGAGSHGLPADEKEVRT